MFARMHHVDRNLILDLEQSAWLAVVQELPYWSPSGGKSAFNWCAGPMKRAMLRCYRSSKGCQPYGKSPIPKTTVYDSKDNPVQPADIAERIDLHRALALDPKPQQIMRLIMVALSVTTGADIAKSVGLSKMTICEHLNKAKSRLRLSLTG
jgi:RNA polymerase sigma factor (sigma-70 family)